MNRGTMPLSSSGQPLSFTRGGPLAYPTTAGSFPEPAWAVVPWLCTGAAIGAYVLGNAAKRAISNAMNVGPASRPDANDPPPALRQPASLQSLALDRAVRQVIKTEASRLDEVELPLPPRLENQVRTAHEDARATYKAAHPLQWRLDRVRESIRDPSTAAANIAAIVGRREPVRQRPALQV